MLESNLLVRVQRWKQVLLTIAIVTGVVITASGFGLFHHQEWSMLDLFFRWRPAELPDSRIVLVTIDESDVRRSGQWPLPNAVLDDLLETLKAQQPRVIGLDLNVELPNANVAKRKARTSHADAFSGSILTHNDLLEGLDFPVDGDGRVRRSWLSMRTESGKTALNFGLRLSLKYLESDGMTLEPLTGEGSGYRLGQTALLPFPDNDGDEWWGNDGSSRLLMNYRGTQDSFNRISLSQVLDGDIPPDLMRDRLILVGSISPKLSSSFYTPYSNGFNTPQQTSAVVIHANMASQILSAALDGRPLLKTVSEPVKGAWIFLWSAIGVGVSLTWLQARILQENLSLKLALLSFGLLALGMLSIAIGYVAYLSGWSLPASAPISALIGSAIAIAIAHINQLQQKQTDLEFILQTANAQGDLSSTGFLEKYTQEVALESYTTAIQLMDVLPVGIAFLDTNGTVCYTNTRAQQLLGRESTRPIPSEEIPEFYQIYLAGTERLYPHEEFTGLQALHGKSMRADDMEIRNNNKIIPIECWGTPIYDARGNIQYAILVLQDITDRRQAYAERILFHQELENKTLALQEMEQIKDDFLKRTSHELRTPLNGILGSIQVILDGFCENREEEIEFLEQAKDCSQNLLMLINNLLDLNQIQEGDFALNLDTVDVHACLTKAIYLHLHTIQQKQLSLLKSYSSEPILVRADSLRITQVLVNLIANAIKFTDRGSISIKTEIQTSEDETGREISVAKVTIADTGIGIEPKLQEKMFEAFMMEDGSTTRQYSGMGLGLTISQKFMKMMGGNLTLSSPGKGHGTTVEVTLPLAAPLNPQPTNFTDPSAGLRTIFN